MVTDVFVGTTLGPASEGVVKSALSLARAFGAKIHLLHALPSAPSAVDQEEHARRLRAQARRMDFRSDELGELRAEPTPAHDLLLVAGERPGAAIVLGAQESPVVFGQPLGQTATHVLRAAPECPVLFQRGQLRLPPDRPLVALRAGARSRNLEPILALLSRLVTAPTVDLEGPRPASSRQLASDERTIADSLPGLEIVSGRTSGSILGFADRFRPDLVILEASLWKSAMPAWGHWRIERLVRRLPGSVLVVP